MKKELEDLKSEVLANNLTIANDIQKLVDGCLAIVKIQDIISDRLDYMSSRIDIANERIRLLEKSK